MNNIWATILLAIVCIIISYYLSQFWTPMGWIGFISALAIIGIYLVGRNKRIR
jgi:hypothetical protein